jgi:hypothetical protein
MKINHYLCGIIASINKMKIDFFNQLPLGTKAQKEEATEILSKVERSTKGNS